MFSNTPIEDALDIIRERLKGDKTLKDRTNLEVEDIIELLRFVLTTTYFVFDGVLYRQKFGAAMGSPVSPIVANLYLEDLEARAIATAPIDAKPKLWKRYVDDILDILKRDQVSVMNDHLNQMDKTDSIKFTYEPEVNGKIPFLDILIIRKDDGSVKLCVYRKPTHTDQYLNFNSHHPIQHKLGVVRTLMDRCQKLVTDEQDRKEEENHIRTALKKCGYPEWTFNKVKQQIENGPNKKRQEKPKEEKCKGSVLLPYVQGVSECVHRILLKHKIASAFKPGNTLRQTLVHPKDKREIGDNCEIVYKIPCQSCDKSYIGETGRKFKIRMKEHQDEANEAANKHFTRAQRKASESTQNKSAITDHVAATSTNHTISWEESKILSREPNRTRRWIRESIHIIKESGHTMNRDFGNYQLPKVYHSLIKRTPPPRGRGPVKISIITHQIQRL